MPNGVDSVEDDFGVELILDLDNLPNEEVDETDFIELRLLDGVIVKELRALGGVNFIDLGVDGDIVKELRALGGVDGVTFSFVNPGGGTP